MSNDDSFADMKKKKKKKRDVADEAFEESDDGDEEGRECEYISDSSAAESDLDQQKEMKSVADEPGLRKLLASGSEDDEDDDDESEEQEHKSEEESDKVPDRDF